MQIGTDYIGITTPFYCHDGEGNFVLHKRSDKCRDEAGRWDMGSGKLEFGLTPEENVRKEVQEEYGCYGIVQDRLPAHSIFREEDKTTHWLAIPFFVQVDSHDVILGEPDKMEKLEWFTLNELPTPLHTGFEYTFKKYEKYFQPYMN